MFIILCNINYYQSNHSMLCYLTTNRARIIDTVFHESEIKDIIKVLIKPHNRLSFPKAKEKRKQDTKIVVGILYRSQMLQYVKFTK